MAPAGRLRLLGPHEKVAMVESGVAVLGTAAAGLRPELKQLIDGGRRL
jgi:hypothetical protein